MSLICSVECVKYLALPMRIKKPLKNERPIKTQKLKHFSAQSDIAHNSQKQNPLFTCCKWNPNLIVKIHHHPFVVINVIFLFSLAIILTEKVGK